MPAELRAAVPVWTSRRRMVAIVNALSQQPHVIELCRRAGIAPETWRAIILNDAIDADTRTGRGMATTQVVAAARVQRSPKQVQRARRIAIQIGIMVELYRGRELGRRERLALVKASPGHPQRGLASVYAMTVCPPRQRARIATPTAGQYAQVRAHDLLNVHLPPTGCFSPQISLTLRVALAAAAGASGGAEPPPAARRRRRGSPAAALAAGILTHPDTQTLLSGATTGSLVAQLQPYARGGWQARELAQCLIEEATRRGIPANQPAHSPWGLLKTLLTGIDPVADVHLGTGAGFTRPAVAELATLVQPCGHCDHGWTEHPDGRVSRCTTCPPGAWTTHDLDVLTHHHEDGGDPPF